MFSALSAMNIDNFPKPNCSNKPSNNIILKQCHENMKTLPNLQKNQLKHQSDQTLKMKNIKNKHTIKTSIETEWFAYC